MALFHLILYFSLTPWSSFFVVVVISFPFNRRFTNQSKPKWSIDLVPLFCWVALSFLYSFDLFMFCWLKANNRIRSSHLISSSRYWMSISITNVCKFINNNLFCLILLPFVLLLYVFPFMLLVPVCRQWFSHSQFLFCLYHNCPICVCLSWWVRAIH